MNYSLCKHGHEMTPDNGYIQKATGGRICRQCKRERLIRFRARNPRSQDRDHDILHFGGNRELVIQRDGEKCVECGMARSEHRAKYGKDISVDHIDNNGYYKPRDQRNNDMSNLQTLCLRCHSNKDNRHKKLTYIQAVNIWHIGLDTPSKEVAKMYGVTDKTVGDIRLCKRWTRYLSKPLRNQTGDKA